MIVTCTETVPGHDVVEILGVCRGNTIRARHLGRDILAAFRNLVGGEIDDYTKMMAESREQAMDRMIAHAVEMGADAVVGARFMTSSLMQGAAELLVYGTAVRLGPKREGA